MGWQDGALSPAASRDDTLVHELTFFFSLFLASTKILPLSATNYLDNMDCRRDSLGQHRISRVSRSPSALRSVSTSKRLTFATNPIPRPESYRNLSRSLKYSSVQKIKLSFYTTCPIARIQQSPIVTTNRWIGYPPPPRVRAP